MKNNSGYALVHRSLWEHPAFRNWAEAGLFAWMVSQAAWKATRVRYKERVIHLKRGQLVISVRDLAASFERSKSGTHRLLKRLESETVIGTDSGTGVIVVTICNYDKYQTAMLADGTPGGTASGTRPGQGRDTEQYIKESKEEGDQESLPGLTPVRHPKGYLPKDWNPPAIQDLTPEARKCATQWPTDLYARTGESFALYWRSKRRMMDDWHATFCKWVIAEHWKMMKEARDRDRVSGTAAEKPYSQILAESRHR